MTLKWTLAFEHDTHVASFRGSFDLPELRIKYTERAVGGVALLGDLVAIALDRGDANAIDLTRRLGTERPQPRYATRVARGARSR